MEYLERIRPEFMDAIGEVVTGTEKLFLDSVSLFDVVRKKLLYELYYVHGYGFCYESSALAMMALSKNPTARFIQGTGRCSRETGERCDHAWVEFEVRGTTFVVDWTWFEGELCVPKLFHQLMMKPEPKFVCSYRDFWRHETSKKLFRLMHEKKTSYVFPWLVGYRSELGRYGLELMRNWDVMAALPEKSHMNGKPREYMYYNNLILNMHPKYLVPELTQVI